MKKVALCIIITCILFSASAQKGYKGGVDFGYTFGLNLDMKNTFYSISTTHGYSLFNRLFFGAGLGILQSHITATGIGYHWFRKEVYIMPLYAEIRGRFLQCKFSPFFSLRGGYNISLVQNKIRSPGFFYTPSLGLDIKIVDQMSIYLSAGLYIHYEIYGDYRPGLEFRCY